LWLFILVRIVDENHLIIFVLLLFVDRNDSLRETIH
jgi:hypothetical protein